MHAFVTHSYVTADLVRREAAQKLTGWMADAADLPADQRRAAALEAAQESVRRCLRLDYRDVPLAAAKAHARATWIRIARDPVEDHICRDCGTRLLPRSGGRCVCVSDAELLRTVTEPASVAV